MFSRPKAASSRARRASWSKPVWEVGAAADIPGPDPLGEVALGQVVLPPGEVDDVRAEVPRGGGMDRVRPEPVRIPPRRRLHRRLEEAREALVGDEHAAAWHRGGLLEHRLGPSARSAAMKAR